jgi:branched-chain amino acid transport system ATP-binding protein
MLNISNLNVYFGQIQVLAGISVEVKKNEVVAGIGSNGAGKTTFLYAIAGVNTEVSGSIKFNGSEILLQLPEKIVKMGISMVCQGGRLFHRLSVEENLELGAYLRSDRLAVKRDVDRVLKLFPSLEMRLKYPAGKLSGGEQQMLAISRSLMSDPILIMMDEPTFGLSPLMVSLLISVIKELKNQGKTVLLVEQNARMALQLADRGYVFEVGKVIMEGTGVDLSRDNNVKKAYLGR